MRSRPTFWILLCLLLAAGAWLSFNLRFANYDLRFVKNRPAAAPTAPKSPAAGTTAQNALKSGAAALVKTNQFAWRLGNTTKSIGALVNDPRAILLENALIDTRLPLNLSIPKNLRARGNPGAWIVQARGPIDGAFRAMLAGSGAQIISYIPNNAYLVTLPAGATGDIEANGFAVLPYEPYYKVQSALLAFDQKPLPSGAELNLGLFAGDATATVQQIEGLGGTVLATDSSPFGPVVRVLPPENWTALAQLPGVQIVEPYHPRVHANDLSRPTVGVSVNSITTTNYMNLSGSNVIVEVNDSGIDTNHPDLAGRILFNNPANGQDTDGHGTHVAGIIAGSGLESTTVTNAEGSINPGTNGQYRGKAPLAKLFAMNYNDSDQDLQQAAALTNAPISNNSWIYDGDNTYDLAAASYDAATRDALPTVTGSQPVLFVFSAGNAGDGQDDGVNGDPDSIQSPATAKDVITAGAVEQNREITNTVTTVDNGVTNTSEPWIDETDTGYSPIYNSVSPQVAGYSSRGNVGIGIEGATGRFKPDVVSPGTFVISTRSTEWNQAAYYYVNPTNDDEEEYTNVVLQPGATWDNSFPPVPTNALQVTIQVVANDDSPNPLPGLSIYVGLETSAGWDFFTTNDEVLIPGSPEAPADYLQQIFSTEDIGGAFDYSISNSTAEAISFDVITGIITTNNNNAGNESLVLSNLNNSIGPYYRYETGTSMAAADISGVLALMQDFFINHTTQTNPSPALLKALLINGAATVGNYNFNQTDGRNYQGWGLANLPDTLPAGITNQPGVPCGSFYADQSPTNALATGDSHTFLVTVASNAPAQSLRVTLAWTDPPGNPAAAIKLVNNLDLVVTNLDTTNLVVYFGNDIPPGSVVNEGWSADSLTNTLPTDSINNVKNVFLPAGVGAHFSVTVVGRGVNVNAVTAQTNNSAGIYEPNIVQDYALVVSSGADSITVTDGGLVSNPTGDQDITVITNGNTPLLNQFAGANSPLLGTNTVSLGGTNTGFATNAILTIGQTNQWHFYVITNNSSTNPYAAFVTFSPPTLSDSRMGVLSGSAANATQPTADLDLFVASGPGAQGLTNLDPTVISNCVNGPQIGGSAGGVFYGAALGRGGTQYVVDTNSTSGNQVYYIGVQCEDQEAAEYGFLPVFSAQPFSQNNTNGEVIYGINLPVTIPDGSPQNPGTAYVLAIALSPMEVQDVIVTNEITSQNMGNLTGTLGHNDASVVLNNHDSLYDDSGIYDFVYDDSGTVSSAPSGYILKHSDGPGNLGNFTGQEAVGAWILTETDNSLIQTGSVTGLSMLITPHLDPTQQPWDFTVPANGFYYNYIDVPVGATNLTVSLTNFTGSDDVQMFIQYGQQPTTNDYDYFVDVPAGSPPPYPGGSTNITLYTTPPLEPGRYYVTVFNNGSTPQQLQITASIGVSSTGATTLDYDSTDTPLPILDDAVTTDSMYVTNTDLIASVNVGIRVDHPRISDLAFRLIGPDGTRYLLMENRGGSSTNGAGASYLTTNTIPVSHDGNAAGYTNTFDTGTTNGTISITYNFYTAPDEMEVYYGTTLTTANLMTNTGYISNPQIPSLPVGNGENTYPETFTLAYPPPGATGTSTEITIIMNPGGNTEYPDTAWTYTVTSTQAKYSYLTFTEDTNLTTTPIKFAPPPFVPMASITGTNIISDFDFAAPGSYTNGQTVDGWTVTSNQVSVVDDPTNAYQGSNFLALACGAISNNLPTVAGQSYTVSFAYRGPDITAWWRAEGNANDSIGTNNGAPTGGITYSNGEVGQAFALNGSSSYIPVPASPGLNIGVTGSGTTIEGWINPNKFNGTAMPVIEWDSSTQGSLSVWVEYELDLTGGFYDTSGNPHAFQTANNLISTTNLQHVAFTYDKNSGNAVLYINGVADATQNFGSVTPQTTYPVNIGRRTAGLGNGDTFGGLIDELSLYNRALSSSEISAIYQKKTAGKFDPVVFSASPAQSLAEAQISLGGEAPTTILGSNTTWQVETITFTATQNGTPFEITGLEPGMLLDDFSMSGGNPGNLYYLPEQSLAPLTGQNPQGVWQLEIQDDRAGAYLSNSPPMLDSWQLQFVLASTNALRTSPGPGFVNPNPTNVTMNEYTTLLVTNTATNADTTLTLTYGLIESPGWAGINSTSGVITLAPGQCDAGTNIITTIVTDNGNPPLSATNTLEVIVTEVNTAPFWPADTVTNYVANELSSLAFDASAMDTNCQPDLTYSLSSTVATGTNLPVIGSATGIVTWTPNMTQGPSTNILTVIATNYDQNAPTNQYLTATNFFTVTVLPPLSLTNDLPQTNTILSGEIDWYVVNVPTNANIATNILLYATNNGVNLWFSTNLPPTIVNPGDVDLIPASTNGSAVLGTNGSPVNAPYLPAYIVPGGTYYLGVQNTNSLTVGYAVEVNFHYLSSPAGTNGGFGPITTDGTNLFVGGYLTNADNAIFALAPTNLAALSLIYTNLTDNAWGLAINGTNLYWINPTNGGGPDTVAILAGNTGGGSPTTYTSFNSLVSGSDIASDGTQLYAADEWRGLVIGEPYNFSGDYQIGASRYAAGDAREHPNALTVANGVIYVADSGLSGVVHPQVISIATNATDLARFTTNYDGPPLISPSGIAVSGGALFVADPGATNTVWMIPATTNGTPALLVSGPPFRVINRIAYLKHTLYVTDNDTNGVNGLVDQIALTNPVPVIGGVTVNANGVTLNWSAPIYDEFQVQWTTNLASPITWNTFTGPVLSTTGAFTFTDNGSQSGGLGGIKFYRLLEFP